MRKFFMNLAPVGVLAFLLFYGCAAVPVASQKSQDRTQPKPPAWVMSPPAEDSQYMYFVGSGSSPAGNMAEAEEAARGAVLDEIMRFLGVRITSETTATARASLNSFQTDVVQQLKSSASGRVAGLTISERWSSQQGKALSLYLLARYGKGDLLQEKRRLEEVFKEQVEAVSGPEREAQYLEEQGMRYQAALRYLEAAAAAFKSQLENAEIKFARNINRAMDAISRLNLVKLNDNLTVNLGQSFTQPFTVKVVDGATEADPGMAGVALRAVYNEVKDGRKTVRRQILKTDEQGVAAFSPPPPQFVGTDEVIVSLDIAAALEAFEKVPKSLQPQMDGLEELALGKKVSFGFESVSQARQFSLGVAVFDLDASGNPISLAGTSSGLLEAMSQGGYQVKSLPVAVGGIAGKQDAQILSLLKKNFQGQVQRAIYGTASIANHEQDGQFVIIQVTGSLKVVELESGKILLSLNRSKRATGSSASAALSAAFKTLGQDFGQLIMNGLR